MKRWLTVAAVMMTMLGTVVAATGSTAEAQSTCAGQPVTVDIGAGQVPTTGADVILGTNGPDIINGLGGNDRICGLGGADTINGGPGNDVITGGSGADVLFGSSGNDTIRGQGGNDRITGNEGDDRLYGGENNDTITGDDGDDDMWGDNGRDTMNGGNGNDRIFGGGADDTINGGNGNDVLNGQAGDDTLTGDAGSDTANGGGGINTCSAETTSDCYVDAPEWISGSALTVTRLSRWSFTAEWCCLALALPDMYELTITSSAGVSQIEYIEGHFAPTFTVASFGGYALTPGETFELQVVAINEGGRSEPRDGSVEIPTPFIDVVAAPSVSATASAAGSPTGLGDCTELPTTNNFGMNLGGRKIIMGTLVVQTEACHNGSVVTKNKTDEYLSCRVPLHLELFLNDNDAVVINGGTGQPSATNRFECRIDGAFHLAGLLAGTVLEFDETVVIQHTIESQSGETTIERINWFK